MIKRYEIISSNSNYVRIKGIWIDCLTDVITNATKIQMIKKINFAKYYTCYAVVLEDKYNKRKTMYKKCIIRRDNLSNFLQMVVDTCNYFDYKVIELYRVDIREIIKRL